MRPAHAPYAQALAAAQEAGGDPGQAAQTLATGIARAPANRNLRTAAILLALRHGQGEAAHALAESARAEGLVDALILGLAGHALSSIGRHEEAAESYAEALKLGPKDDYVRHLVAAAGGLPGAPRAPLPYVRAVFNGYARHFELHMASLGYRGPGLIRAAVQQHRPELQEGTLLDLGCGSGFVAVALSDLGFATMCGVDAARGMLEVARSKGLYTELHEADLMERLVQDTQRYDIVTAADVLCYFGDLTAVFVGVRQRLRPDGTFIATVETITSPEQDAKVLAHAAAEKRADGIGAVGIGAVGIGAGANGSGVAGAIHPAIADADAGDDEVAPAAPWRLGPTGRYQHTESHISTAAAAAGLRPLESTPIILRYEADQPVAGLLLVFGRQDD
jgi:predicted TPR repeat methyltransferase